MALYPCPECKREISTDAKACPSCGKDLRFAGACARWKATPKALRIGLVAALCFMLLALWISGQAKDHDAAKKQAQAQEVAKQVPSGPPIVQPGTWFGYRDRELLDRAAKISGQGDKAAWSQLMAQAAAAGSIVPLKPGEEVFIEDTVLMAGAVKIRRKGETKSWWTSMEAVK